MKKKKQIELDIIKHYFILNENEATLELVYDTFSELINPNFGNDKIEKLNEKLLSDIKEAVSILPRKYKLNIRMWVLKMKNGK